MGVSRALLLARPPLPHHTAHTMARSQHDTRVYALFDVPGTGFRDREGTGMFDQYHKIGWQKDFKSEDAVRLFCVSGAFPKLTPCFISNAPMTVQTDYGDCCPIYRDTQH